MHAAPGSGLDAGSGTTDVPSLLLEMCEQLPAAVFLLRYDRPDHEPVVLHANAQACQLWGAELSELAGQPAGQVIRDLQARTRQGRWQRLINDGKYVYHTRVMTHNGQLVQARLAFQRFTFQEDDYYLLFACRPVEALTQANLDIPQQILRVLRSSNPVAIYLKDEEGRYVGFAEDIKQHSGISPQAAMHKTALECFAAQAGRQLEQQDCEAIAVGGWHGFPFLTRGHDHILHELMLYKLALHDAAGQLSGLLGVVVDASEDAVRLPRPKEEAADEAAVLEGAQQLELTDLFELAVLQSLQDNFAAATGVASIITRVDGSPITKPSRFCRLCSEIIRGTAKGLLNCMKSDAQLGKHNPAGPTIQPCLSCGLWDAGVSISVGGRHVANWLIGQVRNEAQDQAQMLEYASYIGADLEEYDRAYAEVKVMSIEQFNAVASLVHRLANWLSEQAYNNLQQAKLIAAQQKAELSYRASQERLELAARSTGLAVWEWDIRANQFTWDDEMYRMYALERGLAHNLFEAYLERVHPEDRERVAMEINTIISTAREFSSSYRVVLPGGEVRHIITQGRVMLDTQGQPERLLGINRDVTLEVAAAAEQQRLEQQIRQAQKLEAVGTLAGGIAHDFNNILFAILGNTELALDELAPDNPLHTFMEEIQRAAQRARKLVKQLLMFSRPSESRREMIVIGEVIREVVALVRATIPTTIEIEARAGREDLVVQADATELHQILLNLCTNAYQAMMGTGGKLSIGAVPHLETVLSPLHVSGFLAPGNYVKVTVSDTGSGISPEIRERIFEPFFTTRAVGQGTGMGLAVVHGLVTSIGGKIRLDSEVGRGTSFHIYLPISQQPVLAALEEQGASLPLGRQERLLLVDDEPAIAKLLTSMLTGLSYQVDPYFSPQLALEAFSRDPAGYDLILTDLTMPGLTGDDLYQQIRKLHPSVPVIIASGNRQSVPFDPSTQTVNCVLLDKPISRVALAQAISIMLAEREEEGGDEARPGADDGGNS
jgi:signal transduction histidine kinase/CheY-like chemotaxis protein